MAVVTISYPPRSSLLPQTDYSTCTHTHARARAHRPGEVEGKDYYFSDRDQVKFGPCNLNLHEVQTCMNFKLPLLTLRCDSDFAVAEVAIKIFEAFVPRVGG